MSWIHARIGPSITQELTPGSPKPLRVFTLPRGYIALGGIPETCLYDGDEKKGWAVVGLGIEVTETESQLVDKEGWRRILSRDTPWHTSLNGHFSAIRWDGDRIDCFTDELGQRTLFFSRSHRGLCISTRLDRVTKTTGNTDIDFSSLGAKWLMFNQLEYGSCIAGVSRLGPRGHAVFKGEELVTSGSTPWLPEFGHDTVDRAVATLSSLVRGALKSRWTPSLGLSGGLDSRILLARLIGKTDRPFRVHTFGDPMDPDVRISMAISQALGLDRRYFHEPLPDVGLLIPMLREYAAQTHLAEPASSFAKLRYYPALRRDGCLMIDGGFGEIARRQYLNRIAALGRSALRRRQSSRLAALMRVARGDFFDPGVMMTMEHGAIESLERVLSSLPPVAAIGIENSVDLLAIRTRVPNWGAPEQARLDSDVVNFMPLVQPSFLRAVFAAKVSHRRSGGLYREIIRSSCPQLANFPLVKAGTTYGFGLSTPAAWLVTKVKTKLGRRFVDHSSDGLLQSMKEYILDKAHSSEISECSFYDGKKISHATEMYFAKGDRTFGHTIDWFLTFELWRKSLSGL